MNNLVRGEIKHETSQGRDMDSFEWVLTSTKLLLIPYISINNKFQPMNVNMNMNIHTLANNNLVIEPNDYA